MSAVLTHHRLSVDDLYKMLDVGILSEDDRIELIEGELIDMSPMGPLHAGAGDYLEDALRASLQQQAFVRIQKPIRLDQQNELEPDIAIVKRADDYYRSHHPSPSDVYLLIEIADSSLSKDRKVKLPLYAVHKIPEVWIIDLLDRCLEVYRQPIPAQKSYAVTERHNDGTVAPQQFPEARIEVTGIFH
jgi:Uma2 family endonuclease